MPTPRYRQLTDILRKDIESGRYPIGSLLPPEVELCETYGVSRHTIRDAIRLLQEAGMVERRRGLGTTVLAASPPVSFVQPLGSVSALLQYARDARLELSAVERRGLSPEERQAYKLAGEEGGGAWLLLSGVRDRGDKPLSLTRVLVPPRFADLEAEARTWDGAFQELIAERTGVAVDRIEQEISAELLDPEGARLLRARRGEAALRTLRRYFDAAGELVLASDSLHPAGRFVYAMTYHRDS